MMRASTPRVLATALFLAFCAPALAAKGDAEAGKKKSEPCKACHGEIGLSVSPDFPNLAGQHPDYLAASLRHYQEGKRTNPVMKGMAAYLSKRDIDDLAAYYASQKGLTTKY
jgi:cytochrome c553